MIPAICTVVQVGKQNEEHERSHSYLMEHIITPSSAHLQIPLHFLEVSRNGHVLQQVTPAAADSRIVQGQRQAKKTPRECGRRQEV